MDNEPELEKDTADTRVEPTEPQDVFKEGSLLLDRIDAILSSIAVGALPSTVWAEELGRYAILSSKTGNPCRSIDLKYLS